VICIGCHREIADEDVIVVAGRQVWCRSCIEVQKVQAIEDGDEEYAERLQQKLGALRDEH